MRRNTLTSVLILTAVSLPVAVSGQLEDPGQLYARVTTMDGEQYEGFVRWDKNEGHWTDVLDASKRIPSRYLRQAGQRSERRRSFNILGIKINTSNGNNGPTRQSGLRMGHIKTIQVLDANHALITLKSGEEQEFRRSSTDLGSGMRGVFIHAADASEADRLDWDEIDFIEFAPAPPGLTSPFGNRLYGVLELENGSEFTGWITWDMDEIFGADVLDGDANGRRRRIKFRDIASIETGASGRAEVTLQSGETLSLRGTNDVNSGNRGIAVGDPGLGQVRINWRQLKAVRFQSLPGVPGYPQFDGGHALTGTVTGADGVTYTGTIRWDNDEAYTWEFLDGEADGAEFKIEFGMIQSIERAAKRGARVTLWDGRAFELEGSNDVGGGNNGVFIETQLGEQVLVAWDDLVRVEFHR